jgi:HEAT repeat protein
MDNTTRITVLHIVNDRLSINLSEIDIDILNHKLPADEVVSILIEVFNNESDDTIKSRAFDAILSIIEFDRIGFLIDLFSVSPFGWQAACCRELSRFHDNRAITKLCDILLKEPNADLRYLAAEGLARIGDAAAIEPLRYAQNNDIGQDYEGFRVSDMASQALQQVLSRMYNQ